MCLCVGVAGGSGSGKTTLVRRLLDEFAGRSTLLEQDAYYYDRSCVDPGLRMEINYDHPQAIEAVLLATHVSALKSGQPVEAPVYDFVRHVRIGSRQVAPAPLVLIEGILVLHFPELQNLLDLKVFVALDEPSRLARRTHRDVMERGRTSASVEEQFRRFTAPMHDQFVEPCLSDADYVIMGEAAEGEAAVVRLIDDIRARLDQER